MKLSLYPEALMNIYKEHRPKWEALEDKANDIRRNYAKEAEKNPAVVGPREPVLDAIQRQLKDIRQQQEELKKKVAAEIDEVKKDFGADLEESFMIRASDMDKDVIAAINAGVRYSADELQRLEKAHFQNITMRRVLYDYAQNHNVRDANGVPVVGDPEWEKENCNTTFRELCMSVAYGACGSPLYPEDWMNTLAADAKKTLSFTLPGDPEPSKSLADALRNR